MIGLEARKLRAASVLARTKRMLAQDLMQHMTMEDSDPIGQTESSIDPMTAQAQDEANCPHDSKAAQTHLNTHVNSGLKTRQKKARVSRLQPLSASLSTQA